MATSIADAMFAIKERIGNDLPVYSDALEVAFRDVNPVFVRKEYSDFFWECSKAIPGWLQTIFVHSAVAESIGSKTLLSYWESVQDNKEAEEGLLWHARDEARHSRIFLRLVDLSFPTFVLPKDRQEIEASLHKFPETIKKSERRLPEPILLNYLALINMAEIRTLINLHLLAPIFYTLSPKENKDRVANLLFSLQRDEVSHIAYTAKIINDAGSGKGANYVKEMYKKNLTEFGIYSSKGLEDAVKTYGGGNFLDLLRDS